jgi:hypothetical protein
MTTKAAPPARRNSEKTKQSDNPAAPLNVWSNDVDTIVASDWDAAVEVLTERYGESEDIVEPEFWRVLRPRKTIRINWNPDLHGLPTPHSIFRRVPEEKRHYPAWTHEIYAPAYSWAQLVGDKSLLCSTQW